MGFSRYMWKYSTAKLYDQFLMTRLRNILHDNIKGIYVQNRTFFKGSRNFIDLLCQKLLAAVIKSTNNVTNTFKEFKNIFSNWLGKNFHIFRQFRSLDNKMFVYSSCEGIKVDTFSFFSMNLFVNKHFHPNLGRSCKTPDK